EPLERALLAIEKDLVLAGEVVVQVPRGEVGFVGDLAHAGRGHPEAAEDARRRAQDGNAPRFALALHALRRGLVRTAIQNLNHCSNSRRGRAPRQAETSAAELESLNFPGRGLGKLRDELDPARVLVGREAVLDVLLQL